jgi:hypothetical protein
VKTLSIFKCGLTLDNTLKKIIIVDDSCRREFVTCYKPPKEQTPKKTLGANLSGNRTATGHTSGEYV